MPEQISGILRQVEIAVSNGRSAPQACRKAGIVEHALYRLRKKYGGLNRHGLVVSTRTTQTYGAAERDAALNTPRHTSN